MGSWWSISGDSRLTEELPGGLDGESLAAKYQQYFRLADIATASLVAVDNVSCPPRLQPVLVPARPVSAICQRTSRNIHTQMVLGPLRSFRSTADKYSELGHLVCQGFQGGSTSAA